MLARFTVSPTTAIFGVTNTLHLEAVWKLLYFVSTVAVLTYASQQGIERLIVLFVANEVVFYLMCLGFALHASRNPRARAIRE